MDLHLHVGSRLPAYCTSMGKVLLAHQEPAARGRCSTGPTWPAADRRPSPRASADGRADAGPPQGIAVNDEELAAGLRSVAAPVRDRTGPVVAAVNIAIHLTVWNTSVESVTAVWRARCAAPRPRSRPGSATAPSVPPTCTRSNMWNALPAQTLFSAA